MTVGDLHPLELYGIVLFAFLTVGGAMLAWREYPSLARKREKAIFWAGMFAMVGLPALMGLMALKP